MPEGGSPSTPHRDVHRLQATVRRTGSQGSIGSEAGELLSGQLGTPCTRVGPRPCPVFPGPRGCSNFQCAGSGSGPCKGLSTVTDVKKMLHYRGGVKCLQRKDATPPTFFLLVVGDVVLVASDL